jgi:hypothetical protein
MRLFVFISVCFQSWFEAAYKLNGYSRVSALNPNDLLLEFVVGSDGHVLEGVWIHQNNSVASSWILPPEFNSATTPQPVS